MEGWKAHCGRAQSPAAPRSPPPFCAHAHASTHTHTRAVLLLPRRRPGLSMDTAIVHGTGEQLGKLDAQPGPHSSLHTIRAHHNINPKTEVEAW